MATMAADRTFIDTNVLVYASRRRSPLYSRAIEILQRARDAGGALRLSRQILPEYLAVVTRPQFSEPALHPSGGRQIHDANIVATMLAHEITRLATFNLADFRRFADCIELVPV
jgi:predicted nucleic acid-binding protein